ncbi:hypothetical protein D9758_000947 [Tetrapyrgos nigripes]|uniref:Uncharacterized protein n=1 Tax=Tetrapyrgos nigripes TaxID=182062 RepID=A0A8H5GZ83_9AGAR|nr:hypothetical protein D9758_000947 [Tetrapyrgos nigripes]
MSSTVCVDSPTATQTQVLTTESSTTSFSPSVTTAQPTVSTFTVTQCVPETISGTTTSSCRTSLSTTTIPGGTTTTSVPIVVTLPVTSTSITTLFGSSCTVLTPVTTPTTIVSETSTTLPNGSVSIGTVTVTTLVTNTPAPTQQSTNDNPHSNDSNTNLGAIVGGSVGGVFGLIALLLIFWFLRKRQRMKQWDDLFRKEDDGVGVTSIGHHDEGPDQLQPSLPNVGIIVEPQSYEYGLVGRTANPVQHYNSQPSYDAGNPYAGMAQRHSSGGSTHTQPLSTPAVGMNLGSPVRTSMRLSPQQSYSDPNHPRPMSMHSGSSNHGGQGHSSYYHGPGYSPNHSPQSSQGPSPMMSPAMSPGAWNNAQLDGQLNPDVGGFVVAQQPTSEYFAAGGQQGQGGMSPRQRMSKQFVLQGLGRSAPSPTSPGTNPSVISSDSSQNQQRRLQVMNQDIVDSSISLQNPLFVEDRSDALPQATSSSVQSNSLTEKQRLAAADANRNSTGNGVMVHRDGGRVDENPQGQALAGPSGHDRQQQHSEPDNGPPPPAYEE